MITSFPLHWLDHLLFFILGLLLPWQTIGSQRKLKEIRFDQRTRISLYIANSLALWLMALSVLALWWWLERPFSELGLRWTATATGTWSLLLLLLFLLIYVVDAFRDIFTDDGRREVLAKLSGELAILPRKRRSYLFFIPLAFSAGICEEIVFRGFFMGYFISLFGEGTSGQIVALAIPALIFTIVHTYQGQQAMVRILAMALLFGAVYLFTGSIFLLIILHVTVDLIGGSVGLFFPEPEPPEPPIPGRIYPAADPREEE